MILERTSKVGYVARGYSCIALYDRQPDQIVSRNRHHWHDRTVATENELRNVAIRLGMSLFNERKQTIVFQLKTRSDSCCRVCY